MILLKSLINSLKMTNLSGFHVFEKKFKKKGGHEREEYGKFNN